MSINNIQKRIVRYLSAVREDRRRFDQIDATSHYHKLQIKDFLRAIREDRPALVTGEEGRIVVEMFTAIYRSNERRQAVKFPRA